MNKISFKYIKEHIENFSTDPGKIREVVIFDQIKIIIDDKYLLDEVLCGMFPLDFFSQNKHFFSGKLQIGICGCSCYECGDIFIDVKSDKDRVIWYNEKEYIFDKNEYEEEINNFKTKLGIKEPYEKVKEIIQQEFLNRIDKMGYEYYDFMIYNYCGCIILYFIKEDIENKYYIRWNNDFDILKKNIELFKMENM